MCGQIHEGESLLALLRRNLYLRTAHMMSPVVQFEVIAGTKS